jgi:metal-responsive CopG/Arc/MetJ family transcriptional regulator
MMATPARNVTVSLPPHLVELVDTLAGERASTRSAVVAAILQAEADRRLEAAMREGYRAMAPEDAEIAAEFAPTVHAGLRRDP